MTPKDIVLSRYLLFAEGDVDVLSKINQENALLKVYGDRRRLGEYKGIADFRDNSLAHIPNYFPNLNLEIMHVLAADDRVHIFVKYTENNLSTHGVYMFFVEDELQKEFTNFDDSQ